MKLSYLSRRGIWTGRAEGVEVCLAGGLSGPDRESRTLMRLALSHLDDIRSEGSRLIQAAGLDAVPHLESVSIGVPEPRVDPPVGADEVAAGFVVAGDDYGWWHVRLRFAAGRFVAVTADRLQV